jgi:hypothetical protein
MSKVFFIGRRRTGRGSVIAALKKLGYKSSSILKDIGDSSLEEMLEKAKDKDFIVSDREYTLNELRVIEQQYKSSLFILTERDIDEWYSSWCRFYDGKSGAEKRIAPTSKNHYAFKFYKEYNEDIKQYFKGREWKLLNIHYGRNASWATLCSYFKKPLPTIQFPHENILRS